MMLNAIFPFMYLYIFLLNIFIMFLFRYNVLKMLIYASVCVIEYSLYMLLECTTNIGEASTARIISKCEKSRIRIYTVYIKSNCLVCFKAVPYLVYSSYQRKPYKQRTPRESNPHYHQRR